MDSSRDFKQSGTYKTGLLYKSARKPLGKREISIVQVEFGKIIGIERTELCFVKVLMGNVSYYVFFFNYSF